MNMPLWMRYRPGVCLGPDGCIVQQVKRIGTFCGKLTSLVPSDFIL